MKSIGLIGFGRIGLYLYTRLVENPDIKVNFVFEVIKEKTEGLDGSLLVGGLEEMARRNVDLVIEAADFRAVKELAPRVLANSDMLVLSASALAEESLFEELQKTAKSNGRKLYVPHGAVLGMDGLQDAREALRDVSISTIKSPKNLDFTFQDRFKQNEIDKRTVIFSGPTRQVCKLFPRNVNSHAVVALSGIGFDKTRSELIADPSVTDASHLITVKTNDSVTSISQSSAIKGVSGEYTLASVCGTVLRILSRHAGLTIM